MQQRANFFLLCPETIKSMIATERTMTDSDLPLTLLLLVKLRVSQMNGCAFGVDLHAKHLRIHDERELRMHHLVCWHNSPLFDERERAALAWAEVMTKGGPDAGSETAYAAVSAHFSETQLCQLSIVIAMVNCWNRLTLGFRTRPGVIDRSMGLEQAGLG